MDGRTSRNIQWNMAVLVYSSRTHATWHTDTCREGYTADSPKSIFNLLRCNRVTENLSQSNIM